MHAASNDFALVIFSVIAWFSSMLGLPPEARDPVFIKAAPADAVLYLEWAPRGEGKTNGEEFEGLVGDPEIRSFFREADGTIRRLMIEIMEGSEDADRLAKAIPEFLEMLMMSPGSISVRFDQSLVGPAIKRIEEEGGELPVEAQGMTGIVATVMLRMGEKPDEMEEHVARTIKTITEGEVKTDKLDHTLLPIKVPGMQLLVHRHKEYLIFSTHVSGIDDSIGGIDGKDQGLSGSTRFQETTEKVAIARTGSLFWLDVKGIYNAMTTGFGLPGIMANGVVTMLGLEKLDSMACVSGVEDGKVVVRNWTNTQGITTKAMAFASGSGIPRTRFDLVPRDADLVVGGSLDVQKAIAEYKKLTIALEQGEKSELLEDFQSNLNELDLSISELLKPFADNAIVYDAAGSGGLFFSGPVLLLEVRDHELATNLLDRIVSLVREKLPPFDERSRGVLLSEGEFLGEKIYFFDQAVRNPSMVTPAFCLTKDSLIVGIHPQSIKGHLRMLGDAKRERFSSRLGGEKGDIAIPEGKVLLVRYLNLQTVGKLSLPFLPYGELAAASQMKMSRFDITTLNFPSSAAILPYLKDHISVVLNDGKGMVYEGRGSLPPQIIDTLFWFLPVFGGGVLDELTFDQGSPNIPIEKQRVSINTKRSMRELPESVGAN